MGARTHPWRDLMLLINFQSFFIRLMQKAEAVMDGSTRCTRINDTLTSIIYKLNANSIYKGNINDYIM